MHELRAPLRGRISRLVLVVVVLATLVGSMGPSTAAATARNGRVVFHVGKFGANLYSVRPDGSGLRQLTQGPVGDRDPSSSPNGRSIVFTCRPPGESADICLIRSDGTRRRTLIATDESEEEPAWSPVDDKIAFVRVAGVTGASVRIYDISDRTEREVALEPVNGGRPSWSPDGTKLLFLGAGMDGRSDVFSVNADGSNRMNLTNTVGSSEQHADWSPDGKMIAFSRYVDRDGRFDDSDGVYTFTMSPDGTDVRQVPGGRGSSVSWAPNGRALVVSDLTRQSYVALFTTRLSDGTRRRITPPGKDAYSPDWQIRPLGPPFPTCTTAATCTTGRRGGGAQSSSRL